MIPILISCTADSKKEFYFSLLKQDHTGIGFNNRLIESDSVNFLTNQYIYIGSGVGVSDFNNDGLQDIFFAGEQVSCRLYINKGNFQFEDVTEKAGLLTDRRCTGVSIVDVNNDGLNDIYVSVSHARNPEQRRNLLFINQSNLSQDKSEIKFSDQAADYGLDDPGFSTQAAFFDYDRDGDLDMYLMNHNVFQNQPNNIVVVDAKGTSVAADKLYRNEGIPAGLNHSLYKDISVEAGISDFGYGLGLTISDLNRDGWPDIYVANDFLSNDLLWLNNKNGTFTNCISHSMRHQSYNSMGADAADINNDLLSDVAVLDMQPENNYRKKTMFAGSNPVKYEMEQKTGVFQPQFTRNMLQLHHGNRIVDSTHEPFFSEIGQLSGISETDWSWSVLMTDFDNDGWKDVHITNGLAKDLTNNDFLFFRSSLIGDDVGGFERTASASSGNNDPAVLRKELDAYGSIKIDNYFFRNNGNLTFSNLTDATGMAVPSISHGAAYGDLDNDGDLDLIINNMNQEAFVWRNELRRTAVDTSNNFLSIQLKGNNLNRSGIGVKVILYADHSRQMLEQYPVRGYLSSVDNRLHFGVGNIKEIDSIHVIWPDGRKQVHKKIKANQTITVHYTDASLNEEVDVPIAKGVFEDADKQLGITFRHDEMSYFDYSIQQLLPQKYSQLGPAIAKADVNGDGLIDFFVGGGSYQSGKLFIQTNNGTFSSKDLVAKNKTGEDASAIFFDADGDNDQDLLIAEGSSEFGNSRTLNVPRLYLNDGKGNFTLDSLAFSENVTNISQAVSVGDYDGDGDDDIFIGGRILANQYPLSPRSYILRNDKGRFTDVTKDICPGLQQPGLITAAIWTDFNNDNKDDLVICGEWMPIRFFRNADGRLTEVTADIGLTNMNGLWRSLQAADIDADGDIDFIAGNMGNNNKYKASGERPIMLYAKDIDGNEAIDLIPAYHIMNTKGVYELFPAIDRTEFAQELPTVKKRYLLNKDFAKVTMKDLLAEVDQKDMMVFKCDTTASLWLENLGDGRFKVRPLPLEVQFAPINAIVANDFDNDGYMDLLVGGNEYQAEVGSGRYDASYGLFLKGGGNGRFITVPPVQSGIIMDGDVKGMIHLSTKNHETVIIAAVNNDWVKCFKTSSQSLNKR